MLMTRPYWSLSTQILLLIWSLTMLNHGHQLTISHLTLLRPGLWCDDTYTVYELALTTHHDDSSYINACLVITLSQSLNKGTLTAISNNRFCNWVPLVLYGCKLHMFTCLWGHKIIPCWELLFTFDGCEALNFNIHVIHQLSVCWNNAYRPRRIYYYTSWESVKALQFYCGGLDFYHVYVKRNLLFYEHCVNWTIWWFVRVFLCLNGHRYAIGLHSPVLLIS